MGWKAGLVEQEQPKIADSIADPEKYDNLFEDYRDSLQAENFVKSEFSELPDASSYPTVDKSSRDIYEIMEEHELENMEDAVEEQNEENNEEAETSPAEIITEEDVKAATPQEEQDKNNNDSDLE